MSDVEVARNRWVLTPANRPEEVDNWRAMYEVAVPPPDEWEPLKELTA